MIVVDTNVIAYLLIEGERSDQAEGVFEKDPEWIAPYLWRSEFRSVLSFYLRKGNISLADAIVIMDEAENLMEGREYEVQSPQVLDLVQNSECSAYDCEYVALAEQLGIKFVTSDRKLLRAFPSIAIEMGAFAS